MRILAVRGSDLASLADPFAVELDAEPLAGAALFAITGETGAGKSTLLDALCLALYGAFPRIAEGADQDIPDVADQIVKARDPRNILRKGATRGHAEVDFVGVDGRTYRASWSVHRARGRPGGQLQPARRLLVRLAADGTVAETLADKATTVVSRVVELTDLTFDQFRRTVVLAQGEFDAFLRAADADRADLLEKITGTEIYARLSVVAFERARAAREALERARERRTALGLLAPEVRLERESRRRAIGAELATTRSALDTAAAGLAARDRLDRAGDRFAAAAAGAAAATEAIAAAGADRIHLLSIDRALALRPVVDALRAARRAEAEAVESLAEAEARLTVATPRFRDAGLARDAAVTALRGHDARIAALQPEWDAAARLDVRIAEARRLVAEAEAPAATAEAAAAARRGELEEVDRCRAATVAALARLAAERDRHPELAPVDDRFEEISDRLDERARMGRDATEAAVRRRDAVEAATTAAARLATLDETEATRRHARAKAETALAAAREALVALREEETRARDEAAGRLAARLAEAAPLHREAEAAATAVTRATDEIARLAADLARLAAALPPLVCERDDLARRLAEGASADRLARAVESADAHRLRATLVEGEPCPVCGATDHPILADGAIREALAALRRERAALETRLAACETAIAASEHDRALAEARGGTAAAALAEARGRLDAAESALAAIDREAAMLAPTLDFDWPILGATARDRLAGAPAALAEARRPFAERIAEADRRRAEIETIRATLDRLDRERDAASSERTAAAEVLARAEREAAVAAESERTALARLAEIDARLAPLLAPLSIGPAELDRDGPEIAARLAEAVTGRRRAGAETVALTAEEQTLEREVLRIADDLARLEQARIATATTLADRRRAAVALRADRAGLLGGAATEVHRAGVEEARRAAAEALDEASAALARAASEHDTALGQIGERRTRLQRAETESARAGAQCERALAGTDLDWEHVAALLAIPDAEVEALRARLAALADAAIRAAAETDARRADLDAATADTADLAPRADLAAAAEAARTRADALNREIGALDETLAGDDEAHLRAAEIETEIAALEEEAAVSGAVDAAIGSASGDKFRRFAQGVTLDRLAALAGRHLATLAPRYRLVRTDGLGLAILDRDMGEETRSTRSLSGGERFLASLALALALSGLEGRRSFVDTLFIDEGFGSLDAATLDVAVDALESLQSEGRKVGVISHVGALHDRIPVQIRVTPVGGGRSRIRVVDAAGSD